MWNRRHEGGVPPDMWLLLTAALAAPGPTLILSPEPAPEVQHDLVTRADRYLAEANRARLRAYEAMDQALEVGVEPMMSDIERRFEAADAALAKAAKLYAEALPALSGADAVRVGHALGSALLDLGRDEEALAAWKQVLQIAPDDARARLALAEHAFAQADLATARTHYEAARADAELGPYATYKLAWTLYDLGEVEEAKALLRSIERPPSLVREAQKDLERFSAQ